MLLTGRDATRRLQAAGVTERSARRVLAAGLAGTAVGTTAARLYDEDAVEALAARTAVDRDEIRDLCPHGLFLARRPGSLEDLAGPWPLSPWAAAWIRIHARRHGFVPLVGAVAGFVTVGGEIVDVRAERLTIRPAGAWFARFHQRRVASGPGAAWLLLNVPGWSDHRAS